MAVSERGFVAVAGRVRKSILLVRAGQLSGCLHLQHFAHFLPMPQSKMCSNAVENFTFCQACHSHTLTEGQFAPYNPSHQQP